MRHVQTCRDPKGVVRRYYRRAGFPRVRLHAEPGTAAFEQELRSAGSRHAPTVRQLRGRVWVYFIQDENTGAIKIGSALNVGKRLRAFQTAWPGKLSLLGAIPEPVGGSLERTLHQHFKALRIRGEWFRPGSELMDYIERHVARPDDADATLPSRASLRLAERLTAG